MVCKHAQMHLFLTIVRIAHSFTRAFLVDQAFWAILALFPVEKKCRIFSGALSAIPIAKICCQHCRLQLWNRVQSASRFHVRIRKVFYQPLLDRMLTRITNCVNISVQYVRQSTLLEGQLQPSGVILLCAAQLCYREMSETPVSFMTVCRDSLTDTDTLIYIRDTISSSGKFTGKFS